LQTLAQTNPFSETVEDGVDAVPNRDLGEELGSSPIEHVDTLSEETPGGVVDTSVSETTEPTLSEDTEATENTEPPASKLADDGLNDGTGNIAQQVPEVGNDVDSHAIVVSESPEETDEVEPSQEAATEHHDETALQETTVPVDSSGVSANATEQEGLADLTESAAAEGSAVIGTFRIRFSFTPHPHRSYVWF
jgi:hypothetical protein